jgi:hypothetical protein
MATTFNIAPVLTTNAAGTFNITLDGFIQGIVMDDPAMRFQLTGGTVDPAETNPMWGGLAIYEVLALGEQSTKPLIKRSTAANLFTGFSVFNQAHAMVSTSQSQVPMALPGMSANCYRWGSLARIPLQMDPALVASLPGLVISPSALYWDPTNLFITTTTTSNYALPTSVRIVGWNAGNSMTVSYASGTGYATWNRAGNCILLQI